MKMNALVHASVNQLSLVDLRIAPCSVPALHQYIMPPAEIERFIYVVDGDARFHFGNDSIDVTSLDMVYLPSETAYRSQWLRDSNFMVIDLILHDIDGQPIHFDEAPSILFHDTHKTYRGLLEELASIAMANGPFDWLERLSLSFKFLCRIARDTNQSELDCHLLKIKPGLTYLEHNYAKNFSIEDLAKMSCLSVGSFRRSFSSCIGMTPVDYRNKLRIQKAVELLKSKQYTVGEAAEAVGIQDIKYFSKLFKRYTGTTPRIIKNT